MYLVDADFRIREVNPRIREQHEGVALVALTGWGQEEDRRRSEEAGFDAHLVKPVDPAALTKLIAGLGGASRREGSRAR